VSCLCSVDAADETLRVIWSVGYGSEADDSSTDNRVRPICVDGTVSPRDISFGLKASDNRHITFVTQC